MITVNITSEQNFKFDADKLKSIIKKTLKKNSVDNCVIDVAIVGKEKMEEINAKYYSKGNSSEAHPIFTFPENIDNNFIFPPDGKRYLGQMVIRENSEEELEKLAEHGSLHLVGIHH